MESHSIKFGTDGWRAIIGKDFIPSNIIQVIQAFCDWRLKTDPARKMVYVGFDRRLHSEESAKLVCEVLAGNGFTAFLSKQFCPTPAISWLVKNSDAFAGIMVTASHNPANWNGIKFKEEYGGSASPEYTSEVEKQVEINFEKGREPQLLSFDEALAQKKIKLFDPHTDYLHHLKNLVDFKAIEKSSFRLLHDPLYGASTHFFKILFPQHVDEIHTEADITFGGLNPEPIDKNLSLLLEKMKTGKWAIGIANDGDADRIGVVDDKGDYVNSHEIFSLLLMHYVEDKKLSGPIVKSVSTTRMVDILCQKYGLEVIETPIGFKHICKNLVEKNALMGGEESGGISFAPHVHERDGVLNGLMLLDMMVHRKKTLSQLRSDLFQKVGNFYFDRWDIHVEIEKINLLKKNLQKTPPSSLAGKKVVLINPVDGFKYILEDESWVLIRPSGTEPLLRLYAEAGSKERVVELLTEIKKLAS